MAAADGPSLAELGEGALIERLATFAPAGQFNDDAALLDLQGPHVLNTDVLVEGVHFSEATTSAFDVGWRAAAANLSDLAAMGCREVLGLTVGLVAPGETPWSWVEAVYTGLRTCLEPHGGQLLGGDCSGGAQRLLAVTALGPLARTAAGAPAPIRRAHGEPGDRLVSTGHHGLSGLGLALLQGTGWPRCVD
ncbi:MAG: AIR synthase related protein, partial [Synechococcaceae cyanobacterium]